MKVFDFNVVVTTNTDRNIVFRISNISQDEYAKLRNQFEFILDKLTKQLGYCTTTTMCNHHYEEKKI